MKIAITTFGGDGGQSGISRYIIELLKEFDRMDEGSHIDVHLFRREKNIFLGNTKRLRAVEYDDNLAPPIRNILWHQLALPKICRRESYDVVFLPAGNRRLPWKVSAPTVGTVHDFSSIHLSGKYDKARTFYIKKVLPGLVRRLDRAIAPSESSAKDIVEFAGLAPEQVDVIPNAIDPSVYKPQDPESHGNLLRDRYGIRPPYLLYVSRLEHPGKNHVRLIDAFRQVRDQVDLPLQLVLVGSDWLRAEAVHSGAAACPYAKDIVFPGFIQDEHLPQLYSGAEAFVFPSLYEGFGIPILEAMACGTAVTCSNLSSMPEVLGNAGPTFDPYDTEAIAHCIRSMVEDPSYKQECIQKGLMRAREYSWHKTARATLDSLKSTMRVAAAA